MSNPEQSSGELTLALAAVSAGEPEAGERLLPLVYDELRRVAAILLARENPGHTLQATALVHEAYLRIASPAGDQPWDNWRHFFAAVAEAFRLILVYSAGYLRR